jgi:hypothetical protein
MKSLLCLGLGLVTMTSMASAAEVEFRGSLCILQATALCQPREANEVTLGLCYEMRFLPPGIGGNSIATSLMLLRPVGVQFYRLDSGSLFGAAYQTVSLSTVYVNSAASSASMRITSPLPPLLATTGSVSIVGNIRGFDAILGCDVQFRGAGVRHEVN